MKIGVFDSGVGGLSVANAIRQALPQLDVVYADDKVHVPYGSREPQELHGFVLPILQRLVSDGCEVLVIACNTVTTTLLPQLSKEIQVPLIGMEPLVQAAVETTKSRIVAVCATPVTLASTRYDYLKQTYASDVQVIEPDCSRWSRLIEDNEMNEAEIRRAIVPALDAGADVIVLGCTHYHWIEKEIQEVANGRAQVVQPEQEVIEKLSQYLL